MYFIHNWDSRYCQIGVINTVIVCSDVLGKQSIREKVAYSLTNSPSLARRQTIKDVCPHS